MFSEKIRTDYIELINYEIDNLVVNNLAELDQLIKELKLLILIFENKIPMQTLQKQIADILEMLNNPQLFVQQEADYKEFQNIVLERINSKIAELSELSEERREIYIQELHARLNKAKQDNAIHLHLIKNKKPPQQGTPAHTGALSPLEEAGIFQQVNNLETQVNSLLSDLLPSRIFSRFNRSIKIVIAENILLIRNLFNKLKMSVDDLGKMNELELRDIIFLYPQLNLFVTELHVSFADLFKLYQKVGVDIIQNSAETLSFLKNSKLSMSELIKLVTILGDNFNKYKDDFCYLKNSCKLSLENIIAFSQDLAEEERSLVWEIVKILFEKNIEASTDELLLAKLSPLIDENKFNLIKRVLFIILASKNTETITTTIQNFFDIFEINLIDLLLHDNDYLMRASISGNLDFIKWILQDYKQYIGAFSINCALKTAFEYRHWPIINFLSTNEFDFQLNIATIAEILLAAGKEEQWNLVEILARIYVDNPHLERAYDNLIQYLLTVKNWDLLFNILNLPFKSYKPGDTKTIVNLLKAAIANEIWDLVLTGCLNAATNMPHNSYILNYALEECAQREKWDLVSVILDIMKPYDLAVDSMHEALRFAAFAGECDIVKNICTLFKPQPNDIIIAIKRATLTGQLEIIKYLLSLKNVNQAAAINTSLKHASENGQMDIVDYFCSSFAQLPSINAIKKALIWASGAGRLTVIEYFIDLINEKYSNNCDIILDAMDQAREKHQWEAYNLLLLSAMDNRYIDKQKVFPKLKKAEECSDWIDFIKNYVKKDENLALLSKDPEFLSENLLFATDNNQWSEIEKLCSVDNFHRPKANALAYSLDKAVLCGELAATKALCARLQFNTNSKAILAAALKSAAQHGQIAIIEYFCSFFNLISPDSEAVKEALQVALHYNQLATIKYFCLNLTLRLNKKIITQLIEDALTLKKWDIINFLVSLHNELEPYKNTINKVFMKAAKHGSLATVMIIDKLTSYNQATQEAYLHAFWKAIRANQPDIISYLITDAKIKFNLLFLNETLEWALENEKFEVVISILQATQQSSQIQAGLDWALKKNSYQLFGEIFNTFRLDKALVQSILLQAIEINSARLVTIILSEGPNEPTLDSLDIAITKAAGLHKWAMVSIIVKLREKYAIDPVELKINLLNRLKLDKNNPEHLLFWANLVNEGGKNFAEMQIPATIYAIFMQLPDEPILLPYNILRNIIETTARADNNNKTNFFNTSDPSDNNYAVKLLKNKNIYLDELIIEDENQKVIDSQGLAVKHH